MEAKPPNLVEIEALQQRLAESEDQLATLNQASVAQSTVTARGSADTLDEPRKPLESDHSGLANPATGSIAGGSAPLNREGVGIHAGWKSTGAGNTGTQTTSDRVDGDKVLGSKFGAQVNMGGGPYFAGPVIFQVAINSEEDALRAREAALATVQTTATVSQSHVEELRELLSSLEDPVPSTVTEELFPRVVKESHLPAPEDGESLFDACLDFLRRKRNLSNEAPFLVFFEACAKRAGFHERLDQRVFHKLERWKDDARKRVGISEEVLAVQVDAALHPPADVCPPVLIVRIEPDLTDTTESSYYVRSWIGTLKHPGGQDLNGDGGHRLFMPVVLQEPQDGSDAPAYEVPVHRNALVERLKSVVISSRSLLLKTHGPVLPRIELVLPYRLFDWNTQEVEIRARESLPASYPLILRSWERNYPWWENPFAGPANPDVWISKCQELPGHPLMPHHIRWVDDDSDLSQLADHLAKEQVWGLFAPCPRGGRGKASQQILVAALSGGLPCVIWPLVEALDCEDQRHALLHWLCAFALQELPERLHRVRRNDHPEWQQLAVLWDDPRHPLPDRDYSALTTD